MFYTFREFENKFNTKVYRNYENKFSKGMERDLEDANRYCITNVCPWWRIDVAGLFR